MENIGQLNALQCLLLAEKLRQIPKPMPTLVSQPMCMNPVVQSLPFGMAFSSIPLGNDIRNHNLTAQIMNPAVSEKFMLKNFLVQQEIQRLEAKKISEMQNMQANLDISRLYTEIPNNFQDRSPTLTSSLSSNSMQMQEKAVTQARQNAINPDIVKRDSVKQKRTRKLAADVARYHKCPYQNCGKAYG